MKSRQIELFDEPGFAPSASSPQPSTSAPTKPRMAAEVLRLLDNVDVLVGAPDGVKEIRSLILQLAVRGGLVAQDPGDETVGELLSRIDAERSRQVAAGRMLPAREVSPVRPSDQPYLIPKSWCWVRLAKIGMIVGGGTPSTARAEYWTEEPGVPWLTPADLYGLRGRYVGQGRRFVTELGLRESSARLLPRGSVLFSSRAPIGYVAIAERDLATNQGFKSCVPVLMEMNLYIETFLRAAAPAIEAAASGTTFKEVSGKDVSLVAMPLPPLPEQKRIVEKVDRLMAICDDLEASLRRAEDCARKASKVLARDVLKRSAHRPR